MNREEWRKEQERQVAAGERFWDMADLKANQSVYVIIGRIRLMLKLPPSTSAEEVFRVCCYAYYGPAACNGKDFEAEVKKAHADKEVPLYVGRKLLVDPEPVRM